jgi:transposase
MRKGGRSVSEISRELGISRPTVYKWIARWEEDENVVDRPRAGRPRITTPHEDHEIIQEARRNPFSNAVAIRSSLHLAVTPRTVRRRLHEANIHHRIPACKHFLTEQHKEARLHFAQLHANKTQDFWEQIIFTDEKTFRSSDHGKLHCWRPNNTRYNSENIYLECRSGHVTANVWGWMCGSAVGEITRIEGRFTSDVYLEILEEVMIPSVRALFPTPERITIVHDRSPIHMARRVRQYFDDQPYIDVLDWPSRACDLNPIENLWGIMINEWEQGHERQSQQLYNHIHQVWEGFRRTNLTRRLVNSMPGRLQDVIEKHGDWTRF